MPSFKGEQIAAGAITATQLNASVAGTGMSGGGGSPLSVQAQISRAGDAAPDATVTATGTAAGDVAAIAAAITAVGASLASPKRIALIGAFKMATAPWAQANYITFEARQATFTQELNNVTSAYIFGTNTDLLFGILKYSAGTTALGFFGGRSWIGGVVEGWSGHAVNTSHAAARINVNASDSVVFTVKVTGNDSEVTGTALGATVLLEGYICRCNGSFGGGTLSSGMANTFIGTHYLSNITLSSAYNRWISTGFGGAIAVTGAGCQLDLNYAGGTSSVTLSGKDSIINLNTENIATGNTITTIALSNVGGSFRAPFRRPAATFSMTNTRSRCNIDLDIFTNDAIGNPIEIPLGTDNTVKLKVEGAGSAIANELKLILKNGTRCTVDARQNSSATVALGANAIVVQSTITKCTLHLHCPKSGDTVTIDSGVVNNKIYVYSDIEPTIDSEAKLANEIEWFNTASGYVEKRWSGGIYYRMVAELVDFGGTGPKTTSISIPYPNNLLLGVSTVITVAVSGTNPAVPTTVGLTWDAGGMTDPVALAGVAKDTRAQSLIHEIPGATASLVLTPLTALSAPVLDATGKVRVRFTTIQPLAGPLE